MTETLENAPAPACGTKPKVVLVGPPGAGKSTIGRRLSRALNVPLVDSDALIEEERGIPCGEVFESLGEPDFRRLEAKKVAEALNTHGVVSLGGGAVVTPAVRELLADQTVVWIDITVEEGVRRTSGNDSRPVLQAADPYDRYRQILQEREEFYREVADFRVVSDRKPPAGLVADILNFLESL
ncbi:shikimate kinase [Corynebacterium tapiri]|uniref:Shikimate kinase n=1 Tax=Corynebacterium tapiri TaxID=1448266 RepID=A0A5C4U5W8_9CORY|nr:shikimate kinase [Corynebacterium tapiri]TNL97773.1 shikimate kinase [Corynebacterium tapiri]